MKSLKNELDEETFTLEKVRLMNALDGKKELMWRSMVDAKLKKLEDVLVRGFVIRDEREEDAIKFIRRMFANL